MKNENKNTDIYTDDCSTKDTETKKTVYRTKNKAGDIAEIPNRLPVITNAKYQNAMTFNKNDKAYLQKLSRTDNLDYQDGILLYQGQIITVGELNSSYTEDGIEKINLSLLRAFYGIILNAFANASNQKGSIIDSIVTIYYPDFAKKVGKSSNIGKSDVNEFIKNIKNLQSVIGIINNETGGDDILPVLVYIKHDISKNTVSFKSPYIARIICDIYNASIKRNKTGNPVLKKNGDPQMLPAYSYLIDMSITKEKNRRAVEIVLIVVALIEQAGNNVPHISAKTIIERNQQLYKSLNNKSASNKNSLLRTTFAKAWKLLGTKTYLANMYKNIKLPDSDDTAFIPTLSTLDMVFTFPHEGKIKNSQTS